MQRGHETGSGGLRPEDPKQGEIEPFGLHEECPDGKHRGGLWFRNRGREEAGMGVQPTAETFREFNQLETGMIIVGHQ